MADATLARSSADSKMPLPADAVARARSLSAQIHERQYQDGLRTIQKSDWATDIYNLILNECPNVPEEQVVRLFRNRHPSEAEHVLGQALFHEYNLSRGMRKR